ncbi:MAG TPA: hypothetical protein VGT82_16025 [Ktedonobacteraceae bacterium]|nr:hypothetical protein [Ktedonobacteraceae bacterium]
MLPTNYSPTSTTFFSSNVARFGQAEVLHYFVAVIETGGKR